MERIIRSSGILEREGDDVDDEDAVFDVESSTYISIIYILNI